MYKGSASKLVMQLIGNKNTSRQDLQEIKDMIKKLEESGYLRRQGEKGDLRRYRLTITPAGIKARDKGAEAVNRIFGAALNRLSAADQAALSRIVDQLQPRTSKTKHRST